MAAENGSVPGGEAKTAASGTRSQLLPSCERQTAAWTFLPTSADPTATKPADVLVTPSIAPAVGRPSCASRVHVIPSTECQTAGTPRPPTQPTKHSGESEPTASQPSSVATTSRISTYRP